MAQLARTELDDAGLPLGWHRFWEFTTNLPYQRGFRWISSRIKKLWTFLLFRFTWMISYEVLGATFWPCSGLRGEDRPASRGNTHDRTAMDCWMFLETHEGKLHNPVIGQKTWTQIPSSAEPRGGSSMGVVSAVSLRLNTFENCDLEIPSRFVWK